MARNITGIPTLALILYNLVLQLFVVTRIDKNSLSVEKYLFSKQYFGKWYLVSRIDRRNGDISDDIHDCRTINIMGLPKNNIHNQMRISIEGVAYALSAVGSNITQFRKEVNGDIKYQPATYEWNYVLMEITSTGYQRIRLQINFMDYVFYRNPYLPKSEREEIGKFFAEWNVKMRFIENVDCEEPVPFTLQN